MTLPVEPCSPDGVTTLFYVLPCTDANPPFDEWCETHQHVACPVLPPTGSTSLVVMSATGLLLAGVAFLALGGRRVGH